MSNTKFYSIEEFKAKINMPETVKAQVVKSPSSGKLFLAIGSKNFKCQASITSSKAMRMLVENDNIDEACLVNVNPAEDNVLFTL